MKTSIVFTLAALCQSAFALKEGTYTIGSATLANDNVLKDVAADQPVEFGAKDGNPGETWFFTGSKVKKDTFTIASTFGGYINCGEAEGSVCIAGDNETQSYYVEKVANSTYQLVAENSGYFLRVNDEKQVVIAGWDQTPNEDFILTEFQVRI
ncbi:hypothetical protein N7493_010043 [Penicillium malachiteum]|uniref:Uncharacterized protein n=1 Tax=Penicillium malachiteum TaxID=1324776 RepID=A0AAD6HDZ4_9EURO|nr:hypothetical protein N7493_010043 [Penicillium malachiteum]